MNQQNKALSTCPPVDKNYYIDDYGVQYTADKLILVKAPQTLIQYSVPSTTKVICDRAFSKCQIEYVSLPQSLEELGEYAFAECKNLKEINFTDNSIRRIRCGTFVNCYSLRRIIFPNGVQTFERDIFGDNTYYLDDEEFFIERISLPNTVKEIDEFSFCVETIRDAEPCEEDLAWRDGCIYEIKPVVKEIIVPNGMMDYFNKLWPFGKYREIQLGLYKENDSIYAYKVEHAMNFSFKTMMSLTKEFVSSLEDWQKDELYDELNRGVDLLSTEPLMNMYLYAYGKMHEAKLKLAFDNMGEDYKQLDDFAIIDYGCGQGLASVVLYDHLKTLGIEKNVNKVVLIEPSDKALRRAALHVSKAFPDAEVVTFNKFLDDVTIEDISCVNQMVFHLFSNIIDVESISIDHLAEIVNKNICPNKTIVCVSPNFRGTQRNCRIDRFCSKLDANETFFCCKEKGEWIKGWSCKINVLQKTLKPLSTEATKEDWAEAWEDEFGVKYSNDGKKLLKGNKELETYSIKKGTKVICDNAFLWCESLRGISIPNSVTSIGNSAFYRCKSLQSITIPNSAISIGEGLFKGCNSLQSITIPNSVTSIGDWAFDGCNSLQSITIPNSVTSIGDYAFWRCKSLQSITIPNSVTSIGKWAFWRCESLQNITIPNSVISIGEYVFSGCKFLQSIYIPRNTRPKFEELLPKYKDKLEEID